MGLLKWKRAYCKGVHYQVHRARNSRANGQVFDLNCWSCFETVGYAFNFMLLVSTNQEWIPGRTNLVKCNGING